jgi:hypothetical protein
VVQGCCQYSLSSKFFLPSQPVFTVKLSHLLDLRVKSCRCNMWSVSYFLLALWPKNFITLSRPCCNVNRSLFLLFQLITFPLHASFSQNHVCRSVWWSVYSLYQRQDTWQKCRLKFAVCFSFPIFAKKMCIIQ